MGYGCLFEESNGIDHDQKKLELLKFEVVIVGL
jgi:hypothetical protein